MREVLRGQLSRFGLAGLLQLLEAEALTGWLGIHSVGGVAFSEGEVVQASCRRWTGRDALMELFLEDTGVFRVEAWDQAPGAPLGSLLPLVMEGCRLADEWQRLAEARLVLADPTAPPAALAALAGTPLDGARSCAQLAAAAGMRRTALVDVVLGLVESGAARLRRDGGAQPPRQPHRAAAVKADYYHAMDLGRARLKAGDSGGAVAYFEQALAARPGDRLARLQLSRARRTTT